MGEFYKKKFCDSAIAYLKQLIPPEEETDEEPLVLSEENSPIAEQLFDDCAIKYLVEFGTDAFQYVLKRHLDADGYTKEELHEIGLNNLEELANEMMVVEKLSSCDVYSVSLDRNFDAGLILLDKLWDIEFQKYIRHSYMVTIPARHVLAFCDSEDQEAIRNLVFICEATFQEDDYLLSRNLYLRQDGKWLPRKYELINPLKH